MMIDLILWYGKKRLQYCIWNAPVFMAEVTRIVQGHRHLAKRFLLHFCTAGVQVSVFVPTTLSPCPSRRGVSLSLFSLMVL
jgi:hypothetical protein